MKILHFAQMLPGGTASYLEEIAPVQIEAYGVENVRFLLPESSLDHVPSIPRECIVGFDCEQRTVADLARLGLKLAGTTAALKPDIVHLHSSFAGVARPVLALSQPRPKVIYCPHGWAFTRDGKALSSKVYAVLERVLSGFSDAIVNISDYEQKAAIAAGVPAERMMVIHNGVRRVPEVGTKVELGEGRLNLLFVGRHDPQKGLDILLDAIERQQRDDIHLHVVGGAVVSTGISATNRQRVTFHGWADRKRVAAFMQAADVLVMPSRWEGFGLVAIEAMRAGLPVIVSDRGALPEVVNHGEAGLVVSLDQPDALKDVLEDLTPSRLEALREAGLNRFEACYTSGRLNASLDDLYRRLLEPARPTFTGVELASQAAS